MATDEGRDVVRLDDAGFDALLAAARGESDPSPQSTAVLARPELAGPITAALEPVVELSLVIADTGLRQVHRGWLNLESGLLLLAVRGDERQVLSCPPAFLASMLARLVHLGPRKVGARGAQPLTDEAVSDLCGDNDVERQAALAATDARYAWQLTASWEGGGRELIAVDGDDGLYVATDKGLEPTTASVVYRALTALLPA
ncbi:MAG: hypothetical protein ACRDPH_04245 [Marmoricola sp.]